MFLFVLVKMFFNKKMFLMCWLLQGSPIELSQKYSVYIPGFVTLLIRHYQVRAEAGLRKT